MSNTLCDHQTFSHHYHSHSHCRCHHHSHYLYREDLVLYSYTDPLVDIRTE